MTVYLVTDLDSHKNKIIFIANRSETARVYSGFKRSKATILCSVKEYLQNERKYQL